MKDENSRLNFIIFMGKIVLRHPPKIGYSKQSNPDVWESQCQSVFKKCFLKVN